MSSCEADYIALTTTVCQGIWLARLLTKLEGKEGNSVKLLVDNKSAIALCKNPVLHSRSKHIETRFHKIRDLVEDGSVEVIHVSSKELADFFTKALGKIRFIELRTRIGIHIFNAEMQAQGG